MTQEIPNFGPVLLKFSASWCGPCKSLKQYLDQKDLEIPMFEYDIDTPEGMTLAKQNSVRGVPTMVLLMDGQELRRQTGHDPKKTDAFLEV